VLVFAAAGLAAFGPSVAAQQAGEATRDSARRRLAVPVERDTTGLLGPIESALLKRIRAHKGTVGVAVIEPATGERWGVRADETFPSASLVKVAIMAETFERVQAGDLTLEDPLTILNVDRTGGSGILQHMRLPLEVTVWDAMYLMGALSDNVATNVLLHKLGPRRVSRRMESYGLPHTRVFTQVNSEPEDSYLPDSSRVYGLGETTPNEMAELFRRLYRGEVVDPDASAQILWILSYQMERTGIPRHLPYEVKVSHKTGTMPANRNDCGIVYGPERPFVICVMTKDNADTRWTLDNEAEGLIADLAEMVFQYLNP